MIDRRTVDETEKNRRNKIYSQLLEQKQREVFDLWRRRLRDGAYVVYVDEPDARWFAGGDDDPGFRHRARRRRRRMPHP